MAKSQFLLPPFLLSRFLLTGGAFAAALSLPSVALAGTVTLVATLSGTDAAAPGDPKGSGSFSTEIDAEAGDVCYTLAAKGIGEATAAHIHAAADGKPVVTLTVTGADDDLCIAAEPDVLKPIVASPGDYYVNVHTAAFPKGAIRGTLSKK